MVGTKQEGIVDTVVVSENLGFIYSKNKQTKTLQTKGLIIIKPYKRGQQNATKQSKQ